MTRGARAVYLFEAATNYFTVDPVPEPATLALLGIGAFGLFGCIRRKRTK